MMRKQINPARGDLLLTLEVAAALRARGPSRKLFRKLFGKARSFWLLVCLTV